MNEFSFRRSFGPAPKYMRVLNYKHPHKFFTVIAGPCSVESKEQINDVAVLVKNYGGTHLRGGVFKAGTYPGDKFGWIDESLIAAYKQAAVENNLQNIIEVLNYRDIEKLYQYASCFQVGCRQMQNYQLLKEVGQSGRPVFLKRHPGSTIDEFLGAAEHVLKWGCSELYLIERGSSSHMNHVRWDLSISIIPAIQSICNIPILVDGSHGTGRRDLVMPMTLAGVAAGANGVLIETHPEPEKSASDADQALHFNDFRKLMYKIQSVREAIL